MSPLDDYETREELFARVEREQLASQNGHAADVQLDEHEVAKRAHDIAVEQEAQARAAERKKPTAKLLVRTADLSQSKPPQWAWRDRVLLGYLNLLLGNEGIGKGTLAAALLARWTRGKLQGNLYGKPVCVAVVGDEDGFADVWVPRLHAAKADLSLVKQIERPDGGFIELRRDRDRLMAAIEEHDVQVVYLDALLDNLGAAVNDWHGKQVRDALQPARSLARELGVAVIGSLHPNKSGETFRNLVSGSHAFNAVSRSSLLLAQDPDEDGRVVLVRGKGNLSSAPEALTFEIASHSFKANGHTFDVPRAVAFRKGGELTADDLIATAAQAADTAKREAKRQNTVIGNAEQLLRELLPNDGQWHEARLILDACEAQGIAERTVRSARKELGIQIRRAKELHARAEWSWPTTPDTPNPPFAAPPSSHSIRSSINGGNSTPDTAATPASGKGTNSAGRSGRKKSKGQSS